MRRARVSICLALSTQQINSLRASGVIFSHNLLARRLSRSEEHKSSGRECIVPPEIVLLFISLFYTTALCKYIIWCKFS